MFRTQTKQLSRVISGIISYLVDLETQILDFGTYSIGEIPQAGAKTKVKKQRAITNKIRIKRKRVRRIKRTDFTQSTKGFSRLETLPTADSLSDLTGTKEVQVKLPPIKKKKQALFGKRKLVKEHYSKLFSKLKKKIPSMSETTFIHSFMMFTSLLSYLKKKTAHTIYPSNIENVSKNSEADILSPKTLFLTCLFLSFKIVEDEFMLFLSDFCGVVKGKINIFEELEIYILSDVFSFDLSQFKYQGILQNTTFLEKICF